MKFNNTNFKRRLPLITLAAFAIIFVLGFYSTVILSPDSFLFSDSGDGIKNYFTYASHISQDSSYLDFEGMNYPYGEHFLYTDCHPLFANTFKFVSSQIPFFKDHSIGILNFIMIFGILLTFFFSYLILRESDVRAWLAAIFAISITLLAPQIFRMEGHLSLSYSFAIPLSWWLLLRYFSQERKTLFATLLFLNTFFWLFIHAYLGVIILFFLLMMVLLFFAFDKEKKKNAGVFIKGAFVLILPLAAYYLFNVLTDTHVGRTNNPSGFFLYNAEFDDVFIPHHPPLRPLLDRLTGNSIHLKWEAWSYVGFAATFIFLVLIFSLIAAMLRKKTAQITKTYFDHRPLNIALLASFVVLLFAMGVPFKQFPDLIDYFPVVKQFRATGRFTWPFYFVFMVFTARVLQTYLLKSKHRLLIYLLPLVILLLNIAEALPYHRDVSSHIANAKNLFRRDQLPESFNRALAAITPEDYQAIITLPFYYYGSESFGRPRNDEAVRTSLLFSFHSGIPNVCANLTRTAIPESKKIVQLVSPAFYPKEIINDFPNEKPFLIIQTQKELSNYENELLAKSSLIGDFDRFSLYEISIQKLFENTAVKIFDQYENSKSGLFAKNGFLVSDTSSLIYYDNFETRNSEKPFRGSGGYQGVKKDKNTFAEFGPGTFDPGNTYHYSLWMYNGVQDALNLWFRFLVEEYDPNANSWHTTTFFPDQSEVIFGNWSLVEGEFSVQSAGNFIYLVTKGKMDSKAPLYADDLLVKKTGTDVYLLEEDALFFNNHKVIKP